MHWGQLPWWTESWLNDSMDPHIKQLPCEASTSLGGLCVQEVSCHSCNYLMIRIFVSWDTSLDSVSMLSGIEVRVWWPGDQGKRRWSLEARAWTQILDTQGGDWSWVGSKGVVMSWREEAQKEPPGDGFVSPFHSMFQWPQWLVELLCLFWKSSMGSDPLG